MIQDNIKNLEEMLGREFRLMVVDDNEYNRYAAEQAAIDLGIADKIDILPSEKEALEYFREGKRPSYVITDLEMENKFSGLAVVEEGFKNGVYSIVATGMNLNQSATEVALHGGHGPSTTVIPSGTGIKTQGRKSFPRVWKGLIEQSLKYLTKNDWDGLNRNGQKKVEFVEKIYNIIQKKGSEEGWDQKKMDYEMLEASLGTFGILYVDPIRKAISKDDLPAGSYFRENAKILGIKDR